MKAVFRETRLISKIFFSYALFMFLEVINYYY